MADGAISYDRELDRLSIIIMRNGYRATMEAYSVCQHVNVGRDIRVLMMSKESRKKPGEKDRAFWLYSMYQAEEISLTDQKLEDNYKKIFRAAKSGRLSETCVLNFSPENGLLNGECLKSGSSLKLEDLARAARGSMKVAYLNRIMNSGFDNADEKELQFHNIEGQFQIRWNGEGNNLLPDKIRQYCADLGFEEVVIGGVKFCHDQSYSKESIEIRECGKKSWLLIQSMVWWLPLVKNAVHFMQKDHNSV